MISLNLSIQAMSSWKIACSPWKFFYCFCLVRPYKLLWLPIKLMMMWKCHDLKYDYVKNAIANTSDEITRYRTRKLILLSMLTQQQMTQRIISILRKPSSFPKHVWSNFHRQSIEKLSLQLLWPSFENQMKLQNTHELFTKPEGLSELREHSRRNYYS